MTRFCIITNTDTHVKMAIVDWRCTPLIAIDDPKLMLAKPAGLTAANLRLLIPSLMPVQKRRSP